MDSVKRLLRKFNKEHVRWRRLRKVILSLSCVVTFIVTYALILPALTLDNQSATNEEGVYLDADGNPYTEGTLTAEGDTYSVTVNYEAEAQIPKDATLETHEITQDDPEYQTYYDQAAEAVKADGTLPSARFFDISIIYDGNEIEPAEPVDVTVSFDDPMKVAEDQEVMVVHFAENDGEEKPELLDIKDSDLNDESVSEVSFEQSGFSVVGTLVAVADGWPDVESTAAQIMVIKAADNNYYAVKQDGSLTQVTYNDTNNKVTFSSDISNNLSSYYWYLEISDNNTNYCRIGSGSGTYIYPNDSTGMTTENASSAYLLRDSSGHIYDRSTTVYGTYAYYYLTTDSGNTQIAGQGSSTGGSVVYFVDASGLSDNWPEDGTYYPVVTADNSTYYAVKNDGTLVPVTIEDTSGVSTVVFGSSTSVTESDFGDYQWILSTGTDSEKRQIASSSTLSSGETAYLSPSGEGGTVTTSGTYLSGDSYGHLYIVDENGSYHYLKMNGTASIAGDATGTTSAISEVSADACGVAFYSAASVEESGSGSGGSEVSGTGNTALGSPEASKTLTDNGDGTYELALSVTGKTSSLEEQAKVDVFIIFDNSGSMVADKNKVTYTENGVTYTKTRLDVAKSAIRSTAATLLGQNGQNGVADDAIKLSLITFGNTASYKTTTTSSADIDNELNEITALDCTGHGTNWEDAFDETADAISSHGRAGARRYVIFVSDGNPTFRNTKGDYYSNFTYYEDTSYTGYYYPSLDGTLGTYQAKNGVTQASGDANDDPVFHGYTMSQYTTVYSTEPSSGSSTFTPDLSSVFCPDTRPDLTNAVGLYGTGLDDANWAYKKASFGNYYFEITAETNISRCYDQAKDEALSLGFNGDYDAEFFSIRAFGSADRMNSITRYVITGSDTGEIPENRAFDATSKEELTDAFDSIVSQIMVDLMYTNVTISDGLTGLTNTESKVNVGDEDLLAEPDFRYYKYGGSYGTADSPTEITDEVNSTWPEANRAKYDSTTGTVTWNICSSTESDGTAADWDDINPSGNDRFHLEDGVTYVVKFRVWPDQEAYDTLTSIHNAGSTARDTAYGNLSDDLKAEITKNADGEYEAVSETPSDEVTAALAQIEQAGQDAEDAAYEALSDTLKSQIYKDTNGDYRLKTNTTASVSYDVLKRTIEQPDNGETGVEILDSGTTALDNPEGMILTDTTMKVYKVWEGDTSASRPAFVTLTIYEGDGATGENEHLYQTITLPNPYTNSDTWEYTIYISPALLKTDTNAEPDDEGNYPVITLEEGHTYRVAEVESSSVYTYTGEKVRPYLKDTATDVKTNGSNELGLTAKNTLKGSSVTIRKANNAEALTSSDFQYLNGAHFRLLVKQFIGQDDNGHPMYHYVNYEVTDSEGNTTSYEDFEIEDGSVGEVFANLPSGEYKLVELSAPDGYVLIDKEIFFKVNPSDSTNVLELNRYVPKTAYESDTDVRAAVAAIKDAGFAGETEIYNTLSDDLKSKIVVDGYNEYVAKADYVNDADVIAALSSIHSAGSAAEDAYYNSAELTDEMRAKIYVSSDVIFTSSAETVTNDIMIVKNTAGAPLPNTGSRGTIIVIILGSALIIFAVLSMAARKLRSSVSGK